MINLRRRGFLDHICMRNSVDFQTDMWSSSVNVDCLPAHIIVHVEGSKLVFKFFFCLSAKLSPTLAIRIHTARIISSILRSS